MLHNMLFFWHRYELPAVCLGQVTPEHPRQDLFSSAPPPEAEEATETTAVADEMPSPRPTERPTPRNLSFGTVASDRLSRASSSAGLFGRDEDDASAFYGVNGEVIVHHDIRAPSPLGLLTPIADVEGSSLQAVLRPEWAPPTPVSLEHTT